MSKIFLGVVCCLPVLIGTNILLLRELSKTRESERSARSTIKFLDEHTQFLDNEMAKAEARHRKTFNELMELKAREIGLKPETK